ncbi:15464_t:CDS:2, partial [Racocetra persica]
KTQLQAKLTFDTTKDFFEMLFSNINPQAKVSKGTDFTHKKHKSTSVLLDELHTTSGKDVTKTKKRRSRSNSVKSKLHVFGVLDTIT